MFDEICCKENIVKEKPNNLRWYTYIEKEQQPMR